MEDDRIVVREGHAAAAQAFGSPGDGLRRGRIGERVHLTGLADVPVLAEPAGKVTPRRAEGENRRAREEVVQGFLLDGVDTEAAGSAVGGKDYLAAFVHPDKAETALPLAELTGPWAEVALHTPVLQAMPVVGRIVVHGISICLPGLFYQDFWREIHSGFRW